jgi:hypothetical protein
MKYLFFKFLYGKANLRKWFDEAKVGDILFLGQIKR